MDDKKVEEIQCDRRFMYTIGLSYENRKTLEWFNDHMHETVRIYKFLYALFYIERGPDGNDDTKKLAEAYGLSYKKRITAEWLEDHLHEGIEIRNRLSNKGVMLVTDE